MATLVLTTVGTLVGGPIGGAIGAVIGGQIDHAVLAPKGRQGPRLGDLSVQTSSYGSQIPKLFGTMRVAGTVIWATDLREDSHTSGGGKSGGKTTTYSYSASFAVALSARPIQAVRRIWADGKLLRGAGGDWKSETGFRLYTGSEDQAADPLIAAAEGIAATPAHRGTAYAVFETFQLADYGNRIPSLTFEVVADDGDVAVTAIAQELTEGAMTGADGPALGGFAAGGDSVRGALETLARACPMPLRDDGTQLRIGDGTVTALDSSLLGATADANRQPATIRDRQAAGTLPDAVAVAYYEPSRDYQAGLQNARRDGIGRRGDRIDLPAAIPADVAKQFAEGALARAWIGREQATARIPWRLIGTRAGTLATLDGDGPWRISGWTFEKMALELRLTREGAVPIAMAQADAGRAIEGDDRPAGATRIALLDLPAFDDGTASAPRIWLAAAGTQPGWRRAALSISVDGGASWQSAGQTALPAVMGQAVSVLGAGSAMLFDRGASVEIELLHEAMTLQGADDAALINGANLALLGDEIIQFGAAEQTGSRHFRISRLLRGRRGSEWAIGGHDAGEPFVLLDPATLRALDIPLSAIGATLSAMAQGPGDVGAAATASLVVAGRAVRPPPPVALTAARLDDGTIRFAWIRRSRAGWVWLDGGDVPLGEDAERYRLDLVPSTGRARTVEITTPAYDYSPAAQASDGVSGTITITASVAQLGMRAASLPPATQSWTL